MRKRIFQAFALDIPETEGSVPTLSARGEYELAQHIVACARKYGIPVVEEPSLASGLANPLAREGSSTTGIPYFRAQATICWASSYSPRALNVGTLPSVSGISRAKA